MKKEKIINILIEYDQIKVKKYADYCEQMLTDKDKDGKIKNPWFSSLTDEQLAEFFKIVDSQGLDFDGKHIYIANNYGKISIGYDYQAYKNKMYLAYPESVIDIGIVKESDTYSSWKDSGKVFYKHLTGNPFGNEKIKGAYCVIKNKRGEFLTELSEADILKHKNKSKTLAVWKEWEEKMTLKTVIKSACSIHYSDIYQSIEAVDNENYDLENPSDLPEGMKEEIEEIKTLDELQKYYDKHLGKESEIKYDPYVKVAIVKALQSRKEQIKEGF